MATLYELADVMRSKNAGPFLVTVDIMFRSEEVLDRVISSGSLTASTAAERYGLKEEDVEIIVFPAVRTIKVVMSRGDMSSGGPGDRDVYGAQQHGPLMDIEVP